MKSLYEMGFFFLVILWVMFCIYSSIEQDRHNNTMIQYTEHM